LSVLRSKKNQGELGVDITFGGVTFSRGNYIYADNNSISIDGPTSLAVSDDHKKRFNSYGWDFLSINGHKEKEIFEALKKVQNAMAQVSNKLTNVSFIKRSQDVNKSNYTPIYTHKWKDKPVGHYNYEGMKKIGQLFFESYQTSYANHLQ